MAKAAWLAAAMIVAMVLALGGGAEGRVSRRGAKEEKMVFYMHDILGGRGASAMALVGNASAPAATGLTVVFDDVLTEGPEEGSRVLGRGQGIYSFATMDIQNDPNLLLLFFTAVFHYPPHLNGSTPSFLGSDRVNLPTRDVPIVGGTGAFRLARGVATLSTFLFKGNKAIIKFQNCFQLP